MRRIGVLATILRAGKYNQEINYVNKELLWKTEGDRYAVKEYLYVSWYTDSSEIMDLASGWLTSFGYLSIKVLGRGR